MHVKRRRLTNFESCSVALFTSLALGGAALPARSQTPSSTPPITSPSSTVPSTTSTVPSTPRSGTASFQAGPASTQTSTTIPPNRWTPEQLAQAFKRADADGDGQLSRQEASAWSGLSRSFDQIDGNKDGSISSAEFDEALK